MEAKKLDNHTNLHLVLKRNWWVQIASGHKSEEYRTETEWIRRRLTNFYQMRNDPHYIHFQYGYQKKKVICPCLAIWVKDKVLGWELVTSFGYKPTKEKPLCKTEWGFNKYVNIIFKIGFPRKICGDKLCPIF